MFPHVCCQKIHEKLFTSSMPRRPHWGQLCTFKQACMCVRERALSSETSHVPTCRHNTHDVTHHNRDVAMYTRTGWCTCATEGNTQKATGSYSAADIYHSSARVTHLKSTHFQPYNAPFFCVHEMAVYGIFRGEVGEFHDFFSSSGPPSTCLRRARHPLWLPWHWLTLSCVGCISLC